MREMRHPVKSRKAIVITLDGWSANFLGPYGNTWVETSALNALARDAMLIEHAYADSTNLSSILASFWLGRHSLCPTEQTQESKINSIGELLTSQSRSTHLITDDASVAHHPLASHMTSVTYVKVSPSTQPAADAMQTDFGHFLASVVDAISDDDSDCVWIHSKAFTGSWDAPFELRLALTDEEEDPDPSRSVDPPTRETTGSALLDDPDTAWNLARAYAAQVMSVDRCLEFLFEMIDDHPDWRNALLVVTSPRSFPLGEHGQVGMGAPSDESTPLYGESLHVPLFIRSPLEKSLLLRSQTIVQPACIFATLLEWFEISPPQNDACSSPKAVGSLGLMGLFADASEHNRGGKPLEQQLTIAVSHSGTDATLRTPGWFLRRCQNAENHGTPYVELFVKPDDRWEANEVADRCPEVVEAMQSTLTAFIEAAQAKRLDQIAELPEILFTSTI